MPYVLPRTADSMDAAQGILRCEHFQMAYVTNDMDRAMDLFSKQLGVREFAPLGGPMPGGGHMDARFAWVGSLMYEIICASGPGTEIFMDRLAGASGFAMKQHHLGFLVDQTQWDAVNASAKQNGWDIPWTSDNPLVRACFVTVPELGHYLEYLLPTQIGMDFFNSVPRT